MRTYRFHSGCDSTQKRFARIASTTHAATRSGGIPAARLAFAASRVPASPGGSAAASASRAGRFRSASMMRVATAAGHSTDTPIGARSIRSS
jgi:hypothetical protein